MRRYNESERQFLCEIIPGRSYAEIAEMFNAWLVETGSVNTSITASQVNSFCGNNKISTGRTGQFVKGQLAHNKGKKKWWIGGETTQFKKGHAPHNYRPVGSTRISRDGYIEVKVADPKTWRQLHVITWEKAHGKVPKGHAVIFGDGDKQNCALDNLVLVTRAQLVRMNQQKLIGVSVELTKTGALVAEVMNKIGERKRGAKNARRKKDNTRTNRDHQSGG